MKRFEAFFKEDEKKPKLQMNNSFAVGARFDIIARDEIRALELIEEAGFDPDDFDLEEINYRKDQLGRDYSEQLRDARI